RPLSRERLRVLLWLAGAGCAAAFASCLPRSAHWPLPNGLGGVVGDAMLRLPASILPLGGANRLLIAVVLGAGALFAFAGAAGLLWPDPRAEDDDADEKDDDAE